jgi:hypothetical protein
VEQLLFDKKHGRAILRATAGGRVGRGAANAVKLASRSWDMSHTVGDAMKKLISLMTLGLALSVGGAYGQAAAPAAAASAPAMSKQQNKMIDCNKDAKDKNLKGDERKGFMSSCLKEKSVAQKAQQEKMKSCNKDAGDKKLKGDERKKFMSGCLSA